jgi:hypothetical protein
MDSNAYCHCPLYPATHMHFRADAHGNLLPIVWCGCHRASSPETAAWPGDRRYDAVEGARRHADATDRPAEPLESERRVVHRRAQERDTRGRFSSEQRVDHRRSGDRRHDVGG